MSGQITGKKQPEEVELDRKREELEQITDQLAERELELATLKRTLSRFESVYFGSVGGLYAELDELEAKYAESVAARTPGDEVTQEQANEARRKATETAKTVDGAADELHSAKEPPSQELKDLFREAAKVVHPDRAVDDDDRSRREELMRRLNEAYSSGDADTIRKILEEWESSPDAFSGKGVAADLVRVIRQIRQVQQRIGEIEVEIAEICGSPLADLMRKCEEAEAKGIDLLEEMKDSLRHRIRKAQLRLDAIEGAPDSE